MKQALTQRDIAWFFFPLLLNVQLMSVSHTVINAALAREEDYIAALAAFATAMVLHLFFASPSYQNHTVTIAMVRGRQSLRGVVLFVVLVAVYVSIMLALIAFSPLGDLLLQRVLGVSAELALETRRVVALLSVLPFITGFRGFFQGLVIRARRTGLVSLATGVRIAALFGYLLLGRLWFSGAQLGAFALVACVATETLVIGFFAWRVKLPLPEGVEEKSIPEVLRYAFPLAYSSCLQQAIPLLITAIIGRLADGVTALAAFGVIRGFLFLLAGPLRNLQQAYLTLVEDEQGYRVLKRFCVRLALLLGLLMVAVAFPLNQLVLGRLVGVAAELRAYIAWPLACCAAYPLLYGATNLLRGYFAGAHRTAMLGRSTLWKASFLALSWGVSLTTVLPFSGISVAIGLLLVAELLETGYLYLQKSRQFEQFAKAS